MDHDPLKSHTFSSETLASMDAAFNSVWEAILPDTNDSNRDLVRDVREMVWCEVMGGDEAVGLA